MVLSNMIVDVTISRHAFVFGPSHAKVSAGFTNISSLAVAAFDLEVTMLVMWLALWTGKICSDWLQAVKKGLSCIFCLLRISYFDLQKKTLWINYSGNVWVTDHLPLP